MRSLCVYLSEKKWICCHKWDILEENLEVGDVTCVTQHMDFNDTCLNHSALATSYVAFMRFNGIGGRAPTIPNNTKVFLNN